MQNQQQAFAHQSLPLMPRESVVPQIAALKRATSDIGDVDHTQDALNTAIADQESAVFRKCHACEVGIELNGSCRWFYPRAMQVMALQNGFEKSRLVLGCRLTCDDIFNHIAFTLVASCAGITLAGRLFDLTSTHCDQQKMSLAGTATLMHDERPALNNPSTGDKK